jgi:prepilin-type N-terminal cleavage/methylation domain-containing protein
MKTERGFSALEMITVTGILGIAAAVATPSIIKTNRSYKLNEAAQQVAQAFQSAKYEAIRNNASQTVLIDQANRTITINGYTVQLPTGVSFQTQQSSTDVPDVIKTAAENGEAGTVQGQTTNVKVAVSFPLRPSDNKYEAIFTSRGLPNVNPGTLNWVYLANSDGERVAITISSAGSTNVWRKKETEEWIDFAGHSGGGN